MPILTFVTPNPTQDFDLWIKKSHPDIAIADRVVIDDRAVQWRIDTPITKETADMIRQEFRIDLFQTTGSAIKLFMADMDSTIVSGETLDDMAAKLGIGDQIAAITARAMRGELDFETALTERIKLIAGMPVSVIDDTLAEMKINKDAKALLSALKAKGVYCVLISGGFTQFTSAISSQLGFDAHFGNELIIADGVLTGDVKRPILDKAFKQAKMAELMAEMNLTADQVMAVGDGANDLPMLNHAGAGVGYYPKPLLKDALINRIEYTDLSSLIYTIE